MHSPLGVHNLNTIRNLVYLCNIGFSHNRDPTLLHAFRNHITRFSIKATQNLRAAIPKIGVDAETV